ncbi:sodium-translocating pyrophosphatase [Sphaerochaeta halotolerans]|jgi:K(+)-stimulated pyrophosphate-energized sodium pump|uniref:Putative K(+)-stimulated pyrophosphate-energized sodium pump n=1 Tax=Sphaerochaeta halotolerans TaxID=2293840 RepID=A0A372MFT3_9SPIR|nr:sodium-translocating pyrophosphatase [Sphaerochaeta halotolerans]MXI85934.1 sodium-translocating pyrophosphatase [Sphaerochaeta halotolerans]RFU94293.1 sodium-translocating pyrophosphatase [Sphaerochaeta halotolerans]
MIGFIVIVAIAALAFAVINYYGVKRKDSGTLEMQQIAAAIQEGARAFLVLEYSLILKVVIFIAILLGIVVSPSSAIAFVFGALMSASAGWIGMNIATISNVRVSNEARNTKSLGKTLRVAFKGGSVMGLSVGGFALLGLALVYLVFGVLLKQVAPENLKFHTNWLGISDIPFTMTISAYALGCSIIAMFNRVGGGIYTKAADMGADLVGKTEAGIPEDDPRNPATIADNVGDNVGDVAGLGSDLLESYVGALVSAMILAAYIYFSQGGIEASLVSKLIYVPLLVAAVGIISSMVGILYLLVKKVSSNPHKELNAATFVGAGLTIISTGFISYFVFKGEALDTIGFALGAFSPWVCAVLGIVSGIVIGQMAEYFTSYDFKPTQKIAASSVEGAAITITEGMSVGMISVIGPVMVLGVAIIAANITAGLYGVAMAAIGMLSFVTVTVSVDTYGPIADNAGGISEMAKLHPDVRGITDELDAVGNTTAAIGKGFAIGSATLAALSLFSSYLYAQAGENAVHGAAMILNMVNPLTLVGALVGGALPYLFSGILIRAVANAARKMVQEVRRQFKADPGIILGTSLPDYKTCISISSAGALSEMKIPALIAVLTPLFTGFLFGAEFVGGLLIGTTISSVMLALYTANAGGAWDNGKKYVENGHFGGKGSDAHKAAVVGDTVGDPLKDTVGPSLDILIKIMAVVSLIAVSIFSKYNLFSLLMN